MKLIKKINDNLIYQGLIMVSLPFVIYFANKLIATNENYEIGTIWDGILFYLLFLIIIIYFLGFQCEKIAGFLDKKIGKMKFIFMILYVVIFNSLSFAAIYWCVFDVDQNAFINMTRSSFIIEYLNLSYFSIGVFLMNGQSSIEASSSYSKILVITEMLTAFIAIVLILANYKALRDPFNEHMES